MNEEQVRMTKRIIKRNRALFLSILSLVVVALVAVVCLFNVLSEDRTFSDKENRSLAQRPQLSKSALADGSFPGDVTDWYQDQFFVRDGWMTLKFRAEYTMGQREFNGIYTGEEGYLLTIPAAPDEEALANTAEAVRSFAERNASVHMTVMVVPGAASILTDKLPAGAQVRDQAADIAGFYQKLPENIATVDAAETLRACGEEQIYYRTDHHWTSAGALAAFEAARPALGIDQGGISYKPHTVTGSFQGTLASRSGDYRQKDRIQVYEPEGTDVIYVVNYPDEQVRSRSLFRSEMLAQKDQYTVFFGGNHALVEIRTSAENDRSLLVFKDSYANSFIQFLTPYYRSIVMVDPRYYYGDISTVMNNYSVTDVLFLYSADTLFSDTAPWQIP